jgi:hypothetical protein
MTKSKPVRPCRFSSVAKVIAEQKSLTKERRQHLERWQRDDRSTGVWTSIADRIGKRNHDHAKLHCKIFVEEVLACRELILGYVDPEFLERAKDAERLARFFRGSYFPLLIPQIRDVTELASRLDDAALIMRKLHLRSKTAILRPSKKKKSQPRVQFMRAISDLLHQFCGEFLDAQAAILTEIAFPDHPTSIESVRSARLPVQSRRAST